MTRVLCVLSQFDYGLRERGLSTEYVMFYDVLDKIGYDVRLFDFMYLLRTLGKKRMNEMLRGVVSSFQPHIVFAYLMGDEVAAETLDAITRDTSATTVGYFGDDEWRFDRFSSRYARAFNWVVTTDQRAVEKYRMLGCQNVIHKKTGANHYVFRKQGLDEVYDCTFVGAARLDRVHLFNQLRRDGVRVDCWGTAWGMSLMDRVLNKAWSRGDLAQKSSRTRLSFEEMSVVFEQSRVNLNLSGSYQGERKQVKARVFEVTASGGFLLCEYVDGLEEFFEIGKEIVCFASYGDLADKIRFFLSHESERRRIAEAGYSRTLSCHTSERRIREACSEMGLLCLPG
jgi:spore maturation protein CgeB